MGGGQETTSTTTTTTTTSTTSTTTTTINPVYNSWVRCRLDTDLTSSIDLLQGRRQVTGDVEFQNFGASYSCNVDPTSFGTLTELENVNALVITGNTLLPTLSGMDGLTRIESNFVLRSNTLLSNVDALSALTYIGGTFELRSNAVLSSLAGLSSLGYAGALTMRYCDGVT